MSAPHIGQVDMTSSEEEITNFCQQATTAIFTSRFEVREMYLNYGLSLLNIKQQQRLLKEQEIYNRKQLFWSRILAIATICLALATILLVKFH